MIQTPGVLAWISARPPGVRAAMALGLGAAAALGQAPFDLWPATVAGLAGAMLLVCAATTPRQAAVCLWLASVGYFAVALHWIMAPFFVDAARHGWMAPFALVLLASGLAIFWAVPGWLTGRFARGPVSRILALVGLLAVAEMVRAHVFTGFPWAHPGHVLIDTRALALSALLGPHGLTLAVLAASAGLVLGLYRRAILAPALCLPLVAALLWPPLAAPAPAQDAPLVRLIQPNAPQHLKWQRDMIPVFFDRALALTASPAEAPLDLIVWPETSLPVLLGRSDTARVRMSEAAGAAPILVGAQRFEGLSARNTAALLNPVGSIVATYDKHHLVPFGEYIPLSDWAERLGLRGLAEVLRGGYGAGPGPAAMDLGPRLGRAFVMICYEAIFPDYIRQVARPDWMVHLTNDAWFGAFSGPYQHLALARLRAAEQGVPVLRAANTGVTAVIDARGHVVAALPLNTAGALDAAMPPAAPPTVYARVGDAPAMAVIAMLLFFAWFVGRGTEPLRSQM